MDEPGIKFKEQKKTRNVSCDISNCVMSLVRRFVIVQFNRNVMLCSVTCHIVHVYVHQYFTIRDLDFQLHLFWGRGLCSMIWGQRCLFVLLILVALLTITV